ncbi:hypothetical protein Cob_v002496 [Colletotrichum orbiculare MAFF 240422]|uniref:Uncharacterized protein n=1 Tax=Colletotrichum orbiculare (strain 104-T / ATCC 96160 / CBS 514.97 / LARS 414 / MAFF 240422) TaxID=1213857 RepID=A0A484G3C8_COLOR|nr:hypothetical protein Cob_v002496 [Colletotrichum orbiculare MAFF 240422]
MHKSKPDTGLIYSFSQAGRPAGHLGCGEQENVGDRERERAWGPGQFGSSQDSRVCVPCVPAPRDVFFMLVSGGNARSMYCDTLRE